MKSILIAAILLSLGAGAVQAAPALIAANANVRMGPSLKAPVSDILLQGDLVEVDRCQDGWCFVRYDSYGYIAEALLQPAHKTQRYGFHRNALPHMLALSPADRDRLNDQEMPRYYGHDGQTYGVVR